MRRREPDHPPGSPEWWAGRPAPPARQRGRPPLEAERIVVAALRIIDEAGPRALSMRLLAQRLDSGTATLYRHFRSKDEILAYVVDHVLGEVGSGLDEPAGATWQEGAAVAAGALYRTLAAHPNAIPLLVSQIPLGPNGSANRERAIGGLLAYGFPIGLATRAYTAIAHYVLGFAIQQHAPGVPTAGDARRFRDHFGALDPETYPATIAAARDLTSVTREEEFDFGLRLVLDGLEQARLSHRRDSCHRPAAGR